MKFFDKFLKAIGFESEDDKYVEEVEKEPKKKEKKQQLPTAKFNLKEIKSEPKSFYPTTQEEVCEIVKIFAKGEDVSVDISKFEEEDRNHVLDFLSGASVALNSEIKKIGETIYLLRH